MESAVIEKAKDIPTIYPIFARHETFHPRFGWLKKGYDRTCEDQMVFSKDRAPVALGVGKNMVKAIRYWCLGFKILYEITEKGKKSVFKPSPFGTKLFSNTGWDPYLEDPSSLWILHWNLFKQTCYAPTWYFTFNEFNQLVFTAEDLLFSLKDYKSRNFPAKRAIDSSLNKDINCLLRMYVSRNTFKTLKEDSLDCPFTELGLITAYSGSKRFAFNFGNKPNLSPEIIVSACLEFSSLNDSTAKTISVSRLLYDPGSPGQIFKLTESTLCEAIEQVSKHFKEITLTETAGMIQFSFLGQPTDLTEELLNRYYDERK